MSSERRYKGVIVSPERLFELIKHHTPDIPHDAEVAGVIMDSRTGSWLMKVEHHTYPPLREGEEIEVLLPRLQSCAVTQ